MALERRMGKATAKPTILLNWHDDHLINHKVVVGFTSFYPPYTCFLP
ncbi:MAG: hypothetical protein KAI83_19480 [Thiomargarita sp.]|nr:hypothetical protein [Thiomargarita sp.]